MEALVVSPLAVVIPIIVVFATHAVDPLGDRLRVLAIAVEDPLFDPLQSIVEIALVSAVAVAVHPDRSVTAVVGEVQQHGEEVLLGTIAGILEIVPVLGPALGAVPAVLVALATSPSNLLWVIVLALAVQQLENLFLVPQVQGMTVRLHPAIVMLALLVGSEVAGVLGVILSVPLTAMFRDLVSYVYLRLADSPLPAAEAMARLARPK